MFQKQMSLFKQDFQNTEPSDLSTEFLLSLCQKYLYEVTAGREDHEAYVAAGSGWEKTRAKMIQFFTVLMNKQMTLDWKKELDSCENPNAPGGLQWKTEVLHDIFEQNTPDLTTDVYNFIQVQLKNYKKIAKLGPTAMLFRVTTHYFGRDGHRYEHGYRPKYQVLYEPGPSSQAANKKKESQEKQKAYNIIALAKQKEQVCNRA